MELKGEGVEEGTLAAARKHGVWDRTTFTSFHFEYIENAKRLDPTARVGFLTSATDDETINRLLAIGGEEMAPKAASITEERMEAWRKAGLGVRAWGVSSITLMILAGSVSLLVFLAKVRKGGAHQ